MSDRCAAPQLCGLSVADPAAAWRRLGFEVANDHAFLGGVGVTLGRPGHGIVGWTLSGLEEVSQLAGIPTAVVARPPLIEPVAHPNGATGIDHVVLASPSFDATTAELEQAGVALRRFTRSRQGVRQGFRRLGPAILELVEAQQAPAPLLWGLTLIVDDLEALAARLGADLGPVKNAVQSGRQIATLRASAGLSTAMAFMDPPGPAI